MKRMFASLIVLLLLSTHLASAEDTATTVPAPDPLDTAVNGDTFTDYVYGWSIEWPPADLFSLVYTNNEHGFQLVQEQPALHVIIEVRYISTTEPFTAETCVNQLIDAHNEATPTPAPDAAGRPLVSITDEASWMVYAADNPEHALQYANCTLIDNSSAVGIWATGSGADPDGNALSREYVFNGWIAVWVDHMAHHIVIEKKGGDIGDRPASR
jgi:hypothetical protein